MPNALGYETVEVATAEGGINELNGTLLYRLSNFGPCVLLPDDLDAGKWGLPYGRHAAITLQR